MTDARRQIYRVLRRGGARAGLDVVRRGIYSPIPDVWSLPDAAWDRRAPMTGVDLRLDAATGLLDELAPFVPELQEFSAYDPANDTYTIGDASALYAMVRHFQPGRVLELGSGVSSLLVAEALRRNGGGEHAICDPYPSPLLEGRGFSVEALAAEDLKPDRFAALQAGDLLFVDTSHTVKVGGDVTRIVLDFLPALPAGVLVHFHDIYLPYEYPRGLVRDGGLFWQEQYLLHAFLAFNDRFEVVLPLYALWRERAQQLERAFPGADTPGAFWLRTR